jgi:hypothetical protein
MYFWYGIIGWPQKNDISDFWLQIIQFLGNYSLDPNYSRLGNCQNQVSTVKIATSPYLNTTFL